MKFCGVYVAMGIMIRGDADSLHILNEKNRCLQNDVFVRSAIPKNKL